MKREMEPKWRFVVAFVIFSKISSSFIKHLVKSLRHENSKGTSINDD